MSKDEKWTRENQPAKLPSWELNVYLVMWTIPLTYSYYSIYKFTADHQDRFYSHTLVDGWPFIGGKKDNFDFELRFWKQWFLIAWPLLMGHIVLGQICRNFTFKRRQLMILYDLCAICWLMSPYAVLFVAVNVLAVGIVAYVTRSLAAVWLVLCTLIYMLQWEYKYPETHYASLIKRLCNYDFNTIVLLKYSTFFAYLKMASFSHELINSLKETKPRRAQEKATDSPQGSSTYPPDTRQRMQPQNGAQNFEDEKPSLSDHKANSDVAISDVLQYIFYLPVYFTGPLFTFQDFNTQMNAPILPWSMDRIKVVVLDTLRVLFWGLTWELSLHYIYFYSIQENERILKELTYWELAGEICMIVPFFYIKYIVIYGLPGNIARFDQITPPYTPTCVGATYKYSEDWRHIYIPLGGSRHGPLWQFTAAIACFSFTCFWHGGMDYILAWTGFNMVIVGGEALANYVVDRPTFMEFEKTHLDGAMVRRISTLFWIPMRLLHTMATLMFIGGMKSGTLFIQRMFVDGFPSATISVLLAYYFFLQLCMEGQRRRHERQRAFKLKKA